jgi:hypothetical protein
MVTRLVGVGGLNAQRVVILTKAFRLTTSPSLLGRAGADEVIE